MKRVYIRGCGVSKPKIVLTGKDVDISQNPLKWKISFP